MTNLILTEPFRESVIKRAKDDLGIVIESDFRDILSVSFQPYNNLIIISGRNEIGKKIEPYFADEIINFNLTRGIDTPMAEIEQKRLIAENIKKKYQTEGLTDEKRSELVSELKIAIYDLTKVKAEMPLDGGPQWRTLKPTSR